MRSILLEFLYECSKIPYQKWFKKEEPWDISISQLLKHPKSSLGFHLGTFLLQHDFTPQPKLENHDVFHVLTKTGITVPEEISMQYYLMGNGKRSIYLYTVIFIGTLLYPDKFRLFKTAYRKGRNALTFHQLDFKKLLNQSLDTIRITFLITIK
ncbi:Coq4 family protein [Aquimarina sp. 2201CG14-23]|uniref:Coq4 family protein n=1 Tax=Aquimarina mycalae TaxID=3040073 RepID=UPI002478255D|nr:Coq4 family protein [Aquimarina sp. 2201CG14-23]MDH7444996.1 Coq4 family protein [Aquimarina sp. 2201CG14-23]